MNNEWQPIATAPTDGTKVLVYSDTWDEVGCAYCSYSNSKLPPMWYWDHDDLEEVIHVTHWMPKPDKP